MNTGGLLLSGAVKRGHEEREGREEKDEILSDENPV
jgi:hypothetical protein